MEVKAGYKKTEVGVIPEDWSAINIGNLLEFKNGLNKAKEFFGKGTPIVNYMDIFCNPGLLKQDVKGKVTLTEDEIRNYRVKKGDVFFTRTSETVDEIGMSSVMLENMKETVFSGFVLRGRPKNDKLTLLYKQYCFRTKEVRKQICSTSSYTTRALTNGKLLSNVYIPVPPTLPEQNAIAEVLSDTDNLIQALEKRIAKKRLIKQGAMQKLLTPKEDWEVKKFKDKGVTELITCGIAATPKYEDSNSGVPFLSSTNVKKGKISWNNYKHISKDLHKQLYKNNPPLKGDILYSRVGSIGEAAIIDVDFEFSIYVSLTLIKTGNLLNNEFLKQLLNSHKYKTLANNTVLMGGGVGNLNVNVVREFPISFPLIEEQIRIANILSDMDSEIEKLDKKLAKYKQLKQGLMQELLTGKTRLIVNYK